ncbi:MAG: hypothetical protein RIQ89_1076 [Bacteroidota bacterium]|jgi:linoleoyl-CoA desaturase
MNTFKFKGNQSDFYIELKAKVQEYFKNNNKTITGNSYLYFKAILLVSSFLACYILLLTVSMHWSLALLLCTLAGIATAGIGFNIMHDGSHGSFSKNKTWNKAASLTLNALGCSSYFWSVKHVVVHHTYTNIGGHDDDIENEPFLRLCETQEKQKMHAFQQFYFVLVYGLLYIAWIFYLDFVKYFSRKIGIKENLEISASRHVGFWATKILYTLFFVVLPIYAVGIVPFLIGYSCYMFVVGVLISIVFQLAHCVEDMAFDHSVPENHTDWATHQMNTTCNFSTKSKIVTFFTGGLNFQIEHHLFPKISHVHYPALSKIVKEVSAKYKIKYHEQPTLFAAVKSHYKFLKMMGNQ